MDLSRLTFREESKLKFNSQNDIMLNIKKEYSRSLINKTENFYRNHPPKGQLLVYSAALKQSNNNVSRTPGPSFWSRNLEILDKKNELAKFTGNKNDAIDKLHNC